MIVVKLPFLPVKILFKVARFVGFGRFSLFVLGVVVGLLVAPTTGAELRARLRELAEGEPAVAR